MRFLVKKLIDLNFKQKRVMISVRMWVKIILSERGHCALSLLNMASWPYHNVLFQDIAPPWKIWSDDESVRIIQVIRTGSCVSRVSVKYTNRDVWMPGGMRVCMLSSLLRCYVYNAWRSLVISTLLRIICIDLCVVPYNIGMCL